MSARFEKYTDGAGEYRFRYYGKSGAQILKSEGYKSTSGRQNGIDSVKTNATKDSAYDRQTTVDSRYYFNMKAANGEIIATSVYYVSTDARATAIADVKANAPSAPIES